MGTPRSAASARNTTGGRGSPWVLILLGLFLLLFAILVVTLQTQTSEAYISGTQKADDTIQAQWDIWLQLPKLFLGSVIAGPAIKSSDLASIIISQGIELVYLALVTGRAIAMHSSRKMGRILGVIVFVFLIIIAIFNFYTDLVYGNVSPGVHVTFALFCTLVIGFFPTWGIALIEHGWKRL